MSSRSSRSSVKPSGSEIDPPDTPVVGGIVLQQRASLEKQAAKALALFLGFYLLALLTVVLLALAPFFVIGTLGVYSPYLVLSCYGLAILILVSIVPRPDRFVAPGPDPACAWRLRVGSSRL